MTNLPDGLEEILAEETYERQNKGEVQDAINRLGVNVSETFLNFIINILDLFGKNLFLLSC